MVGRRLLVVIPALNEAAHIEGIVLELARQTASFPGSRVVVADGGSGDGTFQLAKAMERRFENVVVVPNPGRLQAAAVNLAVRLFGDQADVLIRCDAHASYPPNYLSSLVASLERTMAATVVVSMQSTGTTCTQKAVAWISDTPVGSGGSAHRGGRVSGFVDHGHHAAFRMESFKRIGGYNEAFAYNEDAELDCRFRENGAKIYLDASITITYYPRSTYTSLSRQYARYGRGRAGTFVRHPSSLRLRQVLVPLNTALCLVAIIVFPLLPYALLMPAAYLSLLLLFSVKIGVDKRSVCGLGAGVAGFVMHQSWAVGFLRGLAAESGTLLRHRFLGHGLPS